MKMITLNVIFVFAGLVGTSGGFAEPVGVPAVMANGVAYVGDASDLEQLAKDNAQKDAEGKCGGGPILFAENIGFTIRSFGGNPCPPRRFCRPEPAGVSAQGVFVCLANIPRQM